MTPDVSKTCARIPQSNLRGKASAQPFVPRHYYLSSKQFLTDMLHLNLGSANVNCAIHFTCICSNLVVLLSRHLPTTSTWLTGRRSGNEVSITAAFLAAIVRDTATAGVKRTCLGLYNAIATQLRCRIIRGWTATVVTRIFIAKLTAATKLIARIVRMAAAAIACIRNLAWLLLLVVITKKVPIITWSDPRKTAIRFLTVSFYSCGK